MWWVRTGDHKGPPSTSSPRSPLLSDDSRCSVYRKGGGGAALGGGPCGRPSGVYATPILASPCGRYPSPCISSFFIFMISPSSTCCLADEGLSRGVRLRVEGEDVEERGRIG